MLRALLGSRLLSKYSALQMCGPEDLTIFTCARGAIFQSAPQVVASRPERTAPTPLAGLPRNLLACCDEPGGAGLSVLQQVVTISGWALASAGIHRVDILVDGKPRGSAAYGASRADVAADHPQYVNAEHSGFTATLQMDGLAEGTHELVLHITGRQGGQITLAAPFILAMRPSLVVSGWAAAPAGVRRIAIRVDGRKQGHVCWHRDRRGLVESAAQPAPLNRIGFLGTIPIEGLAEGRHTLHVAAMARYGRRKTLAQELRVDASGRISSPPGRRHASSKTATAVLDQYIAAAPHPQNALDLFKGQWSSCFPMPFTHLQAGKIPLFEDGRIGWALDQLGSVQGKTVLELGPLEAGHTYMLERAGAAEIVAIEANTRAYLKCLIVKELLDLQHSRFLCGDFVEYMRADTRRYDLAIACGVLYHMRNPVEVLALLAGRSDRLFLWTHYYDEAIISTKPYCYKFTGSADAEYGGFQHQQHRYEYQQALHWAGFCGGSAEFSNWLSRDEIIGCLRHFGFNDIRINHEEINHPNGPCFSVAARR